MRGNHHRQVDDDGLTGSIPAHAGEPWTPWTVVSLTRVYPRACGGTVTCPACREHDKGLSPRMRGNRAGCQAVRLILGSIPAHAGEPDSSPQTQADQRVYPRACGGTVTVRVLVSFHEGLSPRMRGNHICGRTASPGRGSIPAHAGEPWDAESRLTLHGVYPRACGGTQEGASMPRGPKGLSPRMRGNRGGLDRPILPSGSIPAHAGEPDTAVVGLAGIWVYPGACGGTQLANRHRSTFAGLSPRMRGNPKSSAGPMIRWGSIPAHAGEPCQSEATLPTSGVYPRACGGTDSTDGTADSVTGGITYVSAHGP